MPKAIFNPETMAKPAGRLPVLQYLPPEELSIEPAYQRSIEARESQLLIKTIAQDWNWDRCQVLLVSRRLDQHFVIDGQHRLAAAKLRGDIQQLPCVVGEYGSIEAEAEAFVEINSRRRPLSPLDKFKGAVAAGDEESIAILEVVEECGLSFAKHSNPNGWEPGEIINVGGLRGAWRTHGPDVTKCALTVMRRSFEGQVLRYAGTLFPGIAHLCKAGKGKAIVPARADRVISVLAGKSQGHWRSKMLTYMAENSHLGRDLATFQVMKAAVENRGKVIGASAPTQPVPIAPKPSAAGLDNFDARERGIKRHCSQCDALKTRNEVLSCSSNWCALKEIA